MKWFIKPDKQLIKPVYQQLKESVLQAIERNLLQTGDSIPSINRLSNDFNIAPGTVIRAYEELRQMGIISSKQGKGYFIAATNLEYKTKVFLLFDRMNTYKEILYDSFLKTLGDNAEVNVFFHHYDLSRFGKLIRENLGNYTHYVIMPHFNTDVSKVISKIPDRNLILIDNLPRLPFEIINAVYQDFENDLYNGLTSALGIIKKYNKIWFSLSKSRFQFVPESCITGFERFCTRHNLQFEVINNLQFGKLNKNELYIIFSDTELIQFIKETGSKNWKPGTDIGLLSFDDTPVKEILAGGISVLSTDFVQMGKTTAEMVKGKVSGVIANPFSFVNRGSL